MTELVTIKHRLQLHRKIIINNTEIQRSHFSKVQVAFDPKQIYLIRLVSFFYFLLIF